MEVAVVDTTPTIGWPGTAVRIVTIIYVHHLSLHLFQCTEKYANACIINGFCSLNTRYGCCIYLHVYTCTCIQYMCIQFLTQGNIHVYSHTLTMEMF